MPRALVTGGTGLIGSYLVERLRGDGWEVRALVRDEAAAGWLARLGREEGAGGGRTELVRGDVLHADAFAAAARGCDTIFHAAALVTARGDWEEFRRANVDGTRHAIDAAAATGARLVQVSSVAVYGIRERYRRTPTHEDVPLAPVRAGNHYGRSKRESEQLVMEAHARGRIWATALRPDVVYGRRDRQFVPRVARILRAGVLPLPGGGRTTLAIVHAANVADGIVRAATSDASGGRAYNLANDHDVTVREFMELAAEGLGRRVRILPVPMFVARAGVGVAAAALRWTRGPSFAAQVRGSVDFVTRDNPFTSERARLELGWTPVVHPRDGIPDAFRWCARVDGGDAR